MTFRTKLVSHSNPAHSISRVLGERTTALARAEGCGSSTKQVDIQYPHMEQRLTARHAWEFLDEGRSTFYARQNPKDSSYDPLFPSPITSSTTGRGPRRWKLGAIVAWLQLCESNAASA